MVAVGAKELGNQDTALAVDDALLDQELEMLAGRHRRFAEGLQRFVGQLTRGWIAVHILPVWPKHAQNTSGIANGDLHVMSGLII